MEKDYYSIKAVSNSSLGLINPSQGGSPQKFKRFLDKAETKEETPSLRNGKLIHKYVEDPESFHISDIIKPPDMMCSWVEEVHNKVSCYPFVTDDLLNEAILQTKGDRYKATTKEQSILDKFKETGMDYLSHLQDSQGKHILTKEEHSVINSCIESLHNHPQANNLLFNNNTGPFDIHFNEMDIYWVDEETGLACKALIDRLIILPDERIVYLVDLKTTSKPISLYPDSFEFWRTYRQLAFYKEAVKQWLNTANYKGPYTLIPMIVAVETTGLHEVRCFHIEESYMEKGVKEFRELLNLIKYHTDTQWVYTEEELNNNYIIKLNERKERNYKEDDCAIRTSATSCRTNR